MAGIDLRGELLIGGAWVDATGSLLKRQPLTHTRGRRDQGARVDPSTLRPLLNNIDGQFSPDNPLGPYYGQFGRNTPFRLSVKAGSPALELPGAVGDYASTPDSAALDITGDIDVRVDATFTNWLEAGSSGTWEIIGKHAPGNSSWFLCTFDGFLELDWSTTGANNFLAVSTVRLPIPPSGRMAIRATLDVATAFGDREITFYTAPTMAGPWTQLGDVVIQAFTTSIFNSTAPVRIGDASTETWGHAAGRVHTAEIRNGINGTLAANPDFTAQTIGATSFVDSAGRTWTMNGGASISNRRTRLSHELAAYPTRWHPSGQQAWVEATTAGVLRRYRRGSSQLESTLRRRIPPLGPLAYWPMEEGSTATQAASPIAGVKPLRLDSARWASVNTLASSSPLPAIDSGGATPAVMLGRIPAPATALTGWHVQWVYYLENGPATQRTMMRVLSTGTVAEWLIQSGTGGSTVLARDSDGATVFSQGIGTGTDLFGQWMRVKFEAQQIGGNVHWAITWIDVGGSAGTFGTSFAGTLGRPTGMASPSSTTGFHADVDGMALGHLSAWPSTFTAAYDGAIDAWTGETAGERMQRLAGETGIPLAVCGGIAEMERVGPQLPDNALTLLEEAAEADGGILYEDRERPALRFRGAGTMCNQAPALTLAYDGGVLAPPLEPTGDDDATENDVTVQRTNGSSGRAVLEEGALSVLAPPDGVGPYPSSVSLNLHSDLQAEPAAYWRMHLGTYEGRRYPQVKVKLHKAPPEILEQILAVDIGDKIVITGPPKWVAPDDVELLVQGYDEMWPNPHQWEITFNCTPARPWTVGEVETSAPGHVDSGGSELTAAVTSTATALSVLATDGRPWVAARQALNANPRVVTDLTGWTGNGAAIARAASPGLVPVTDGAWSIQITPNGVAASGGANGAVTAVGSVTVGAQYTVSCWAYSPGGWSDLRACIDWYDSGGVYLSSSLGSATVVPAASWTFLAQTFTAPASASSAVARARHSGTPPASAVWYATQITVRPTVTGEWPGEFPFDVRLGGEVARVEAIEPPVRDSFGRTSASSWGTADLGGTWTAFGGVAADFAVSSGLGRQANPSVSVHHSTWLSAPTVADFDVVCSVGTDKLATGGSHFVYVMGRFQTVDNTYYARLEFTPTANVILSIRKRISGTDTQLATFTTVLTHAANTMFRIRFQAVGSLLRAKVWLASGVEPFNWQAGATDTALTAAGAIGCRSTLGSTTTSLPVTALFDDFQRLNPQVWTVARGINRVVKGHGAATDVRLDQPAIVAP